MIRIGNAPVSYGAFEVTVGKDENVPTASEVLDAVAEAGYAGVDLGPLGYLGRGEELRKALDSRGLLLTGGYVEVDVASEDAAAPGLSELEQVCDQFYVLSSGVEQAFLPRPTVAFITHHDRDPRESNASWWGRIERTIIEVVESCSRKGFEACLHNEVGTEIATYENIVRALESTPVSLCLDTGHLVAAGGDPVKLLAQWRERVSHIHLKDARIPPGAAPYTDAMKLWEEDVFCKLGAGDGRVGEFLAALGTDRFNGWIVVEQDVLPRNKGAYERARTDQIDNRQYLRERGY